VSPSVSGPSRKARAFAPGHVTGVFAPSTGARDPRARGSLGAGIVLEAGVTAEAEWRAGPRLRVHLTSDLRRRLVISEEVARRLAPSHPGTLSVALRHTLPVGQGFGTSASGALATALAVAQVTGRSRSKAVEVAHLADLFGGGGLGGVAAILGGGLEVRVRPGIPPFGKILHRPFLESVLLGITGAPIPTPNVLNDRKALARIAAAAGGLGALTLDPSPEQFWDASEAFTDRAGLAPRELRDLLRGLRRRGARGAQAMFGRSFLAQLPKGDRRRETLLWLARRRVPAIELSPASRGAYRSRPPSGGS
jgi:pantoate kinase